MPRSLKVSPNFIGTVKLAIKQRGLLSQRALSEDLGLALSTVSNFLNGKPIDRAIFEEICLKLSLDWRQVASATEEAVKWVEQLPHQAAIHESAIHESAIHESVIYKRCQDWGEAPESSAFYGRADELAWLERWIVQDQCHLILVLGMGEPGRRLCLSNC